MPKHTIEFNLPGDQSELKNAMDGTLFLSCLQDFDNYLRSKIKHEDVQGEIYITYVQIREQLYKEANDCGFNIWE